MIIFVNFAFITFGIIVRLQHHLTLQLALNNPFERPSMSQDTGSESFSDTEDSDTDQSSYTRSTGSMSSNSTRSTVHEAGNPGVIEEEMPVEKQQMSSSVPQRKGSTAVEKLHCLRERRRSSLIAALVQHQDATEVDSQTVANASKGRVPVDALPDFQSWPQYPAADDQASSKKEERQVRPLEIGSNNVSSRSVLDSMALASTSTWVTELQQQNGQIDGIHHQSAAGSAVQQVRNHACGDLHPMTEWQDPPSRAVASQPEGDVRDVGRSSKNMTVTETSHLSFCYKKDCGHCNATAYP